MKINVIIPADLWEEDEEGVISAWLFDDGSAVDKDDILAEIMVEKVTHELLAPTSGILKQLVVEEEVTVAKGETVAELTQNA